MEKTFQSISDAKQFIIENNLQTAYIIPSYTEGWLSSNESLLYIDISDQKDSPLDCSYYIYPSKEELLKDLALNIEEFYPNRGGDDQYYDYNPSQLESIIYAIYQLPREEQGSYIDQLTPTLELFIMDEEQDDEMRENYICYLGTLQHEYIDDISGLYNPKDFELLKK